jgi:Fe-S cluster assembly iron-binding protein IscA
MEMINISSSTIQDVKQLLNEQKINSTNLRISSRIG